MERPSQACFECHQEIADTWGESDHALANRLYEPEQWVEAFRPRSITLKEKWYLSFLNGMEKV